MANLKTLIGACAIATLVTLSCPTPPAHADEWSDKVNAIAPEVSQVENVGFWNEGDTDGSYRMVITSHGYEAVSSRLFIQWISHDAAKKVSKVIRTMGIKEFNDDPKYYLIGQVGDGEGDAVNIEVIATESNGEDQKAFKIAITGPGKYTISETELPEPEGEPESEPTKEN